MRVGGRSVPDVVGVERCGVGVIVVDDRDTEPVRERAPDVELGPGRVPEVGRATGREHPVGARRARRVKADSAHLSAVYTGYPEHLVKGVHERLDGLVRAFPDQARQLGHGLNKEPP